ncbi:hypothetical protein FBUS_10274 [Fasciolopsis buskii]|uniref:Uncharacterized protein n=1 Tax=Fasciolopsis buskii TaxID=27845 RepID=A0A8E0RRR3_9TREM|nr:hypothetical protein FBUS_10274 [Fasciolopsis buski]
MAPKYKNDLAKCYGLLKLDFNWKVTCEDVVQFSKAVEEITTQLTSDSEEIHPVSKINGSSIVVYVLIFIVDSSGEQTLYDAISHFLGQYGECEFC